MSNPLDRGKSEAVVFYREQLHSCTLGHYTYEMCYHILTFSEARKCIRLLLLLSVIAATINRREGPSYCMLILTGKNMQRVVPEVDSQEH